MKIYVVSRQLSYKGHFEDNIGTIQSNRTAKVFRTKEEAIEFIEDAIERRRANAEQHNLRNDMFTRNGFELHFHDRILLYRIEAMKLD